MWYHYLFFVLGAVLSQFAEWTHLQVFSKSDDWDKTWAKAYGYAVSIALVEYFFSITANRHFFNEDSENESDRQRGFLLQVLWNCVQQVTINLLLALWIGQRYNGFHIGAAVLLVLAVCLAGYGTWKNDEYTSL